MNPIISALITICIYPGALFAIVAAVLLGWVRGYARAAASGNANAAPVFSLREITRRTRQQSVETEGTNFAVTQIITIAAITAPLLALVFMPFPGNSNPSISLFPTNAIAEAALLLGMPLSKILLGWLTPSPYTRLAAIRSVRALLGYVVPFVYAVTVAMALHGSLTLEGFFTPIPSGTAIHNYFIEVILLIAGLLYLICIPVFTRLTPLRADFGAIELASGELTELSGGQLLVMRAAEAIQTLAFIGFGVSIFVAPLFSAGAIRSVSFIAILFIVAILLGVWEGFAPRIRTSEDYMQPITAWNNMGLLILEAAGILGFLVIHLINIYFHW